MNLSVVLGAGFSKAIASSFPTADELGELVRVRAPHAMATAPPSFRGGLLERWMSRIAEPQPDLSDAANLQNARDFRIVTDAIHAVIVELEGEVYRDPVPWWLLRLIGLLHATRAAVATFNYDTLLEAAASRTFDHQAGSILSHFSLTDGVPPTPQYGGMFGPIITPTFRLLKLHGSVDTYWVPGDTTGATIARVTDAMWHPGRGMSRPDLNLERAAPGRAPFIVPPASAKSALFANPITRQLWRSAAQRFAQSSHIVVIGYSAPLTDIVTSAMLADAQRVSGARLGVVNPDPVPVVRSLCEAGLSEDAVYVAAESCEAYVDALEDDLASAAIERLLEVLAPTTPLTVAGANGLVSRVVGMRVDDMRICLDVGDEEPRPTMIDPTRWVTAGDVAKCRDRTGARSLVVERDGERAALIGHYEWSTVDGLIAVLTPSAVRLRPS